jgi:hypothetical protein
LELGCILRRATSNFELVIYQRKHSSCASEMLSGKDEGATC